MNQLLVKRVDVSKHRPIVLVALLVSACAGTDSKRPDYGRDPGAPATVSDAAVAEELARARSDAPPPLNDLGRIVSLYERTRTERAVNFVTAEGLRIVHDLPPEVREDFVRRLDAARPRDRDVPQVIANPVVRGGANECPVAFDDPDVLAALPDQAATQFATEPWVQRCSPGRFARAEFTVYSHVHLAHEDPLINCIITLPDGTYELGREIAGGGCEPVDHVNEPRTLFTHSGAEIIRVRMTDASGDQSQPFDLLSLTVFGPEMKIRCRKQSGQWLQWHGLQGNLIYDLSNHCGVVDELHVTTSFTSTSCGPDWEAGQAGGCPAGGSSFGLDDIIVRP